MWCTQGYHPSIAHNSKKPKTANKCPVIKGGHYVRKGSVIDAP